MTVTEVITLEELMKHGPRHVMRERAHVLLLSNKGFTIKELTKIFDHHRDSISRLINRWETMGIAGLYTKPGQGRPRKIDKELEEDILIKINEAPRSLKRVIADIGDSLGISISISSLKRLAKGLGLSWKRIRKSLKSKRDSESFELAKFEIEDLIFRAKNEEINLFYYDESFFSLIPNVPYAWQPTGQHIEIDSKRSKSVNVLGFMSYDGNKLSPFVFEDSIDSRTVIACFDAFADDITKETVVVIDNAPTHTSALFQSKITEWESKGIYLKFLPPYCPELNKIEILWRFIKYQWIEFWSYSSYNLLKENIFDILKNFGIKYCINFD